VTLSAPLKASLNAAREALLDLHKVLLDYERTRYERSEGAVKSNYHFLQLVIGDPWFAWLRPMSALVVAIDELLTMKAAVPPEDAEFLIERARDLLTPIAGAGGFAGQLHHTLQDAPTLARHHAAALERLS